MTQIIKYNGNLLVITKKCTYCSEYKEINIQNYRQCKYPNNKLYFKSRCRKCESVITYKNVKEKGLSDIQKNKNKIYSKIYKTKNRKKINHQYNIRIKTDFIFKIRKNISRAILYYLKKQNNIKKSSIIKYLEYSIDDLKKHLEFQFNTNMNWDNYGKYWHIDHIIPQSCLPYTNMTNENFKKCWALENLRPLEARQNMIDGATRVRHKNFRGDK